ncbi:UNVERIFIED_CONTAM: hypothetical protein K2H54_027025 [Gekko kuhli]
MIPLVVKTGCGMLSAQALQALRVLQERMVPGASLERKAYRASQVPPARQVHQPQLGQRYRKSQTKGTLFCQTVLLKRVSQGQPALPGFQGQWVLQGQLGTQDHQAMMESLESQVPMGQPVSLGRKEREDHQDILATEVWMESMVNQAQKVNQVKKAPG